MQAECAGRDPEVVYTVIRPGEPVRGFKTSRDAVECLVRHAGVAELHGPNGLIMSQGGLLGFRRG